MSADDKSVKITFRIPGNWNHPTELVDRMPKGYQLTPEALVLPNGSEIDFTPLPVDDEFISIMRSSCRTPMTETETGILDSYTVNTCLSGPGGSMSQALQMMQGAAAMIHAGGAGVFVDNAAVAHSGQAWCEMAKVGGSDAMSFAFVSIINSADKIWTMGMHVLGFPDVEMEHSCGSGDDVIEFMRYICSSEKPVANGHVIADELGPRFHVFAKADEKSPSGSPMFNPWWRLQMKSVRRIAEGN